MKRALVIIGFVMVYLIFAPQSSIVQVDEIVPSDVAAYGPPAGHCDTCPDYEELTAQGDGGAGWQYSWRGAPEGGVPSQNLYAWAETDTVDWSRWIDVSVYFENGELDYASRSFGSGGNGGVYSDIIVSTVGLSGWVRSDHFVELSGMEGEWWDSITREFPY